MSENILSPKSWRLINEFAAVELLIDDQANSSRLQIKDLRTGCIGFLDALELERLSVACHADLTWIVSPASSESAAIESNFLQLEDSHNEDY
jgi:hypothetical protein